MENNENKKNDLKIDVLKAVGSAQWKAIWILSWGFMKIAGSMWIIYIILLSMINNGIFDTFRVLTWTNLFIFYGLVIWGGLLLSLILDIFITAIVWIIDKYK